MGMGETGKRNRRHDGDNKNQKRRTERDEKGDAELVVYRILCPANVIGSVIGKSGKNINSIRHNTGAKVKVVDPFPGAKDRVILIYCYVKNKEDVEVDEEFNDSRPLCSAQDALLKMHATIMNSVSSLGESDSNRKEKEVCQLLVPTSQSANVIGKSGVTIKKMRSKTGANIRVTPKNASDPNHSCALEFDNFVVIAGMSEAVTKAVFAVSSIIYKFAPKEEIPLDTTVQEIPSSIIIPSDAPIYSTSGIYPGVDPIVHTAPVSSVLGSHLQEFPGYLDAGSTWADYSSASRTEELRIRLLCPSHNIGRVIGKGGNSIKTIRQASGAQIEVGDVKAEPEECIITVISKESVDDLKSMAVEAVLLLQGKINDEDEDRVTLGLLVPSAVIGCLIGKRGSIINEIRKRTKADVRISKGKKPNSADPSDELVEVVGEVSNVRDALIQIVLRLRADVLKEQEGEQKSSAFPDILHASGAHVSVPSVLPSIPQVAPLRYERSTESGAGIYSSNIVYGPEFLSVGEYGDNSHGLLSAYSPKRYNRLPPPALEVLIPAHAIGKVLGRRGTNLDNIQNISGASIEITDSKSSRSDRLALISGTPDQKRAAENLIQAFIMAT
ncbi:unnamed protein product [Cuscuta europaea]|uniref:K Homology domain-containing protein n=1 Tax=Cuscuta europaea TaxID=41803 RepID=A0A9P1EPS3_CUSEU|nr:unnamed protein product [Cuscuta europaea]